MKKLLLGLLFTLVSFPVFAQSTGTVVTTCGVLGQDYAVGSSRPITLTQQGLECVNASVSASITGFAPATYATPLNVTTVTGAGSLPAGAVVVVSNSGATNTAYCALGATATLSSQPIPPMSWFAYTVGGATQLSCLTSANTTTVNMTGGTGLPTGAGGGGGGSGGGGSVASGTPPISTMNSSNANSGLNAALAGVFDDATVTAITENSFGFLRMSANRNLYNTLRDAAGNERGANVDASNRLTTAPSMVSGSVASGAYAAGSISAGAMVDIINSQQTKNAGTAAANSLLVGGVYNSTPLTLTNTQGASAQLDANGYLKVNVSAGGAGGGAMTVADGADVTQGANADAAATAGGAGTLSAKLRKLTGTIGTAGSPATDMVTVQGVGVAAGSTTSGQTLSPVGCATTTAAPTNTTGQTNFLNCDTSGQLRVATATHAVTQSGTWTVGQSSPYPAGAVIYTASAVNTTTAATATLAGAASVTTYICGFSIRANATAAATAQSTVTGTISGTLNFLQWTAPLASGIGITEMIFSPCIPASAQNTSIAVVSAAPGAGGNVSVSTWGYKL